MNGLAYYNEIDSGACAWLKELIKHGHIAPGDVDNRSIEDVKPDDLAGYTQCHFFAGIGVWSYSLRHAGWPDNRPAWTGSCPCQPFSAAGKGRGFADERHLWPAWYHLITQRSPRVVFGEQVASPAGLAWLDLVQTDLEAARFAFGALDLCAAGIGAPHLRQRSLWVADADQERLPTPSESGHQDQERNTEPRGRMGDSGSAGLARPSRQSRDNGPQLQATQRASGDAFWSDADWLYCTDGKTRPVEPGTFPLAHGAPARVGRLRGYGNAIVAPLVIEFVRAFLETQAAA